VLVADLVLYSIERQLLLPLLLPRPLSTREVYRDRNVQQVLFCVLCGEDDGCCIVYNIDHKHCTKSACGRVFSARVEYLLFHSCSIPIGEVA
jgi:hypothetical protein